MRLGPSLLLVPTLISLTLAGCEATQANPSAGGAILGPSQQVRPTRVDRSRLQLPKTGTQPTDPGQEQAPPGAETGRVSGLRDAHNSLRALVGVGPLTWSNTLGQEAQNWATHLAQNNGCNLAHDPNTPHGENLYWSSSPQTFRAVAAAWAAEKEHYDDAAHTCAASTCGHYTQMVWAASKEIGCGVATCPNAEIWVCRYDPHGNVQGQTPY